ncbi:heavy-metal-associated domain-containing protein [Paenibacillus pinihumi]|uniref:heavy-metal-associated domain-containing protein n=1 Tax=Paenibacillus pinihumi TaxID=669462 RepID=UPI00041F52C4|nr:heavy-metal-associated domain-containing protein [Paenibacillus pinihumi]
MRLKWIPTVITAVITAALVFGGWYIYQSTAVEKPFEKMVGSVDGVQSAQSSIDRNTISVKLQLKRDANMEDVVHAIKDKGDSLIGGRELKLSFDSVTSNKLEKLWSSVLFQIAESMEKREYSGIIEAMDKLQQQNPGLQIKTGIDDSSVYITMLDGATSKYIVLPRFPATIGAWSHA